MRSGRSRPLRSLARKDGTKQTVRTIKCKQAPCKSQELHAPSRETIRTRHARSYVHTFLPLMYTKKKAQHGTARHSTANTMNTKFEKEGKVPVPSDLIISRMIETPCAGKKKTNSRAYLRLVRYPPRSRSPRHRFGPGKTFLTLCPSETVARLA